MPDQYISDTKCETCGESFDNPDSLGIHSAQVHNICSICNLTFPSRLCSFDDVVKHFEDLHGIYNIKKGEISTDITCIIPIIEMFLGQ